MNDEAKRWWLATTVTTVTTITTIATIAALVLAAPACTRARDHRRTRPATLDPAPELAWSEWSAATFERAAAEDKLILINVVATWCHWCHVMEETTYVDPVVVRLLRERFVVIRVDSDARPDLSERYRAWGWPATAILSPQAEPVLNLRGYRDPEVFADLLRELLAEQDAGALRAFADEPEPRVVDEDLAGIRERAAAQLDGYFDPEGLGWGDKQKYPWADPIDHGFLRARIHPNTADERRWQDRALATLDAERALIDPVWGGMYQYSLRGVWDRPHYEKIAMIQAGAIGNYAHAAMITGDDRWLRDAAAITGYLLTRMQDPAGGFYTSQDADLRRPGQAMIEGIDYYALDDAGRRALGEPRIDTAVYADLNGLIIHALTELDRASPDPDLRAAAVRAGERLLRTHRRAGGGFTHGEPAAGDHDLGLLHLADQAAMGRALLGLHRVTGDDRWRAAAVELAQVMVAELGADDGGFYAHTVDPAAVGVFAQRRKPLVENAVAAQFLLALHQIEDGDGSVASPWLEHARRTVLAVGSPGQIESRGKVVAGYLIALDLLAARKLDVTVVGRDDDPRTEALWRAALGIHEPRAAFELGAPGQRYPDTGAPAVYLCTDRSCSRPLTDPATLAAQAQVFIAEQL